jgi:hypothetical protein
VWRGQRRGEDGGGGGFFFFLFFSFFPYLKERRLIFFPYYLKERWRKSLGLRNLPRIALGVGLSRRADAWMPLERKLWTGSRIRWLHWIYCNVK